MGVSTLQFIGRTIAIATVAALLAGCLGAHQDPIVGTWVSSTGLIREITFAPDGNLASVTVDDEAGAGITTQLTGVDVSPIKKGTGKYSMLKDDTVVITTDVPYAAGTFTFAIKGDQLTLSPLMGAGMVPPSILSRKQ